MNKEKEIRNESCDQYRKKYMDVNIVNYMIPHCLKFIQFFMCMTDITVSVNVIWLLS